jgi:hypothetical protein
MVLRSRAAIIIVSAGTLLAALAYLRDPPWLLNVTSGLTAWEVDDAGARYRWTRGRASFFVPADSAAVVLTMRSAKHSPADWPITATITIDDRPAQIVTFPDDAWREVKLRLPRRGSRDVRRLEIKLDRLRGGQLGIQLQDVRLER